MRGAWSPENVIVTRKVKPLVYVHKLSALWLDWPSPFLFSYWVDNLPVIVFGFSSGAELSLLSS